MEKKVLVSVSSLHSRKPRKAGEGPEAGFPFSSPALTHWSCFLPTCTAGPHHKAWQVCCLEALAHTHKLSDRADCFMPLLNYSDSRTEHIACAWPWVGISMHIISF